MTTILVASFGSRKLNKSVISPSGVASAVGESRWSAACNPGVASISTDDTAALKMVVLMGIFLFLVSVGGLRASLLRRVAVVSYHYVPLRLADSLSERYFVK